MAGRVENLTPFKPGQSGNPKGKPKGTKSITTVLRELMEKKITVNDPISKTEKRMKVKDMLALSLVKKASTGDARALEIIIDRLDGKAVQPNVNFNPAEELTDDHIRRVQENLRALQRYGIVAPEGGETAD